MDWRLRRALGKKVGRRVNVKGKGLTPERIGRPAPGVPAFFVFMLAVGVLTSSLSIVNATAQHNEDKTRSNHSLATRCFHDGEANWQESRQILAAVRTVVPLHTLQKGQYSGIREPLQLIIRTQQQWEDLWKKHSSIQVGPAPPPAVDFSAEMVAGLFLGEKSTGGYEVEITRAEGNSILYLYYREKKPAAGDVTTQALTQPYHLIKVSRHDGSVTFSREGS